jgi:hypothetical protein
MSGPYGELLRQSTGSENRDEAKAYLAKRTLDAYRPFRNQAERSWQEVVVQYLDLKARHREPLLSVARSEFAACGKG